MGDFGVLVLSGCLELWVLGDLVLGEMELGEGRVRLSRSDFVGEVVCLDWIVE